MTATSWGAVAGVVLAIAGIVFGFWAMVLIAFCGLVGGVVGAGLSGRLDLRAAVDAARGRRVG